jgi:MFS family permease
MLALDVLVASASVVFALATAALGWLGWLPLLGLALALAGVAWLVIMSSFNVAAQTVAPSWVSARVLGAYLLVSQGGLAVGSFAWGAAADSLGLGAALGLAAAGLLLGLLATPVWRLQHSEKLDLRPSTHMVPPPPAFGQIEPERGPVLVTIEYRVPPEHLAEFAEAMQDLRVVRRRDGALRWGLYQDPSKAERFVEAFVVGSWAEHMRQHERATMADRAIEERVQHLAAAPPNVQHLVALEG